MHTRLSTAACLVAVLGVAPLSAAQSTGPAAVPMPDSSPTSPLDAPVDAVVLIEPNETEREELARWMDEYVEWKAWWARWAGRPEPGWLTGYRDRRVRPAPPSWLDARCESRLSEDHVLVAACALMKEWKADPPILQPSVPQTWVSARAQGEEEPHITWWEHVHVDVLWPAMQWRASVYGVVGVHTTAVVRGRMQVFLAPGAMLLNVPTNSGTRTWKLAANYGFGYRIMDFRFPGTARPASLHVNLAKAWLLSDVSDAAIGKSVDFVGFSLSFKKVR